MGGHACAVTTMDTVQTAPGWIEVWVAPDSDTEHLLVLRPGQASGYEVVDPQQAWNLVHNFETYEAAYYWLSQETYVLIEGRRTVG